MGKVAEKYKEVEAYIIEMRRWFHAHPELSLEEKETSAKIKEELTKMDISFEELKPNYGIVATIEGVETGKTIVVRGDIDALPVKEDTGLDFASKNEGLMHACGHDAHIAMLLGTAKVLKSFQLIKQGFPFLKEL
ncbi:MAG TPA: M20/M25/M40 family metallo-hydrolase [Candidatus Scybalomonas excrementigallinarum]|nr:M20/M25/M40 family metallo-hydrolase [Candidatus Scybalomonas excrementigallinarum]